MTTLKRTIYLLPLLFMAAGIVQFSCHTIITGSFVADCHNPSAPYRFLDFCGYYAGGKIAAGPETDRSNFYSAAVQHRYLNAMRGTDPLGAGTLVMQYPPFVPCLLVPLAMLSPDQAFAIYFICSSMALFGSCFLLAKTLPQSGNSWPLIACACLGTVPIYITTMLGQMSCYMLLFVSAYFYCLYKKRDIAAGLFLALTTFKPHYALFWSMAALGQKRWKAIIAALIAETTLLALATIMLGWRTVAAYPATILGSDSAQANLDVSILMICFRGLLYSATHSPYTMLIALVVMLLCLGGVFALWRRGKVDFASAVAASVVICLFTSVHTYVYDGALLIIPALLLISNQPLESKNFTTRFATILLLATPYVQWLGMWFLPYNLHRSLPTALILLALTIALVLNAKAADSGESRPL